MDLDTRSDLGNAAAATVWRHDNRGRSYGYISGDMIMNPILLPDGGLYRNVLSVGRDDRNHQSHDHSVHYLDGYSRRQRRSNSESGTQQDDSKDLHMKKKFVKGKTTLAMGYRADCEKCRLKLPGHYSHFIRS